MSNAHTHTIAQPWLHIFSMNNYAHVTKRCCIRDITQNVTIQDRYLQIQTQICPSANVAQMYGHVGHNGMS